VKVIFRETELKWEDCRMHGSCPRQTSTDSRWRMFQLVSKKHLEKVGSNKWKFKYWPHFFGSKFERCACVCVCEREREREIECYNGMVVQIG
jgi:hypothetical protein